MIIVPLAEAKNRLSELITRVQNGEHVSVTRRGKPVANLVAVTQPQSGQQTQQDLVADVFRQLNDLGNGNLSLDGDLKTIAREGLR